LIARWQMAVDRERFVQSIDAIRLDRQGVHGELTSMSTAAHTPVTTIDLRAEPEQRQATLIQAIIAREASQAPESWLWASLIQLTDQETLLVLYAHPLSIDAWEMLQLYADLVAGYQDSAHSSARSRHNGKAVQNIAVLRDQPSLQQQRDYWHGQLRDCTPTIELPAAGAATAGGPVSGALRHFDLPAALLARLPEFAAEQPDTLLPAMLAAWLVLLYRYSRQNDLVVGVASQQALPVQHFLPLRTIIHPSEPFSALLQRVRQTYAAGLAQRDLPWPMLAETLEALAEGEAGPLLPVTVTLHAPAESAVLTALCAPFVLEQTPLSADLSLHLVPTADGGLRGMVIYSASKFSPAQIAQMLDHYVNLLTGVGVQPAQTIARLPLLSARQQQHMLQDLNATAAPGSGAACIQQLLERQTDRTPHAQAVSTGQQHLTYAELDQQANQLAHYLQHLGVGPDQYVGICLPRSIGLIVGILAILKAGGAYVPLDPTYPTERLKLMLEDSAISVLITQSDLGNLPLDHPVPTVLLDRDAHILAAQPAGRPASQVGPGNLAYMIYTSGSTGKPKGVMIEHQALVNFTEQAVTHYAMTAEDRVLQCSSISWDTSAEEIYPCLASGGTLLLRSPHMLDSVQGFIAQCREWRLTVINLASAFWHELMIDAASATLNQLDTLRLTIIGGERVNPERVAAWYQTIDRRIRLMNTYGASEATAITTTYDLTAHAATALGQEVPIGGPFPNIQTYLLDAQLQPVPFGVLGDLYIGGRGLARGYHLDAELTASKFIPHPWSQRPGARLYRTGDVARYREDGSIEYFGRLDHQVKIRGHRIALGEIEAALNHHPAVRDVIVLAREDQPGRKRLVAYVIAQPDAALSGAELREFLATRLPAYMRPAAFVLLGAFPLTPNGKINRRALPAPEQSAQERLPAAHAQTPTEQALGRIWADVLHLSHVAVEDNFFDLGGHSLLAMHLITAIQQRFQSSLALQTILAYPTLGEMAGLIDGALTANLATVEIDFAAEAVLDPAISFPGQPNADPAAATAILLTGATGFLGAFLLAELLQQTAADIYCLVRSRDHAAASARIQQTLHSYGLGAAISARIKPIPGDLAKPLLGLSAAVFAELAATIDCIYHNGAAVNFVYPYPALKAANVQGTHEIIRLAGTGKAKPLHFISTLAVAEAASVGLALVEETTSLPSLVSDSGYVQSKWVAEKLVMQAQARGLAASIYRPDRIAGHSVSGMSNADDFFFRWLAGCCLMHAAPDLALSERMLPVDYVSRAIVHLAGQPTSTGQAFHLFHQQPLAFAAIIGSLQAAGYAIERLPYAEWRQRLRETAGTSPEHPLYAFIDLFPLDPAHLDGLGYQSTTPVDNRNTRTGLSDAGLVCPPLDSGLIQTYAVESFRYYSGESKAVNLNPSGRVYPQNVSSKRGRTQ
jgi:amino acid adenylation domain-containing protein/thioester reductase-like protein